MNHLGGIGFEWFMLSGSLGSCRRTSEPPGVSHLWMATQEQKVFFEKKKIVLPSCHS
jgi:hypothetical protein